MVCSSVFSTLWRGTPCQDPFRKGLGPGGYCKNRKLCLRCPQSSLSIPRNDDMARHNLWRKRQTSPSSLLLIGMDSSQRRDGPCQGLSMANKKLVGVRKPQIFQVADITTSFLTGPISLHSILMLETGNLSCADLHRHVAVHPFISFPIIQ